ncbi:hypothetical protein ACFQ0B_62860 [Nonomuraea thailandensis]
MPQPDPRRLQLTPGPAAWRAHARDNAAYDRSCRIAAGPAYAGLTSWQVAHDLDAVRAALGQPRLRYFGNAYGAVYGQAYLKLFPRRVERMYLEGVPDHGEPGVGRRLIAHARAAERQLASFRAWCAGRLGCPSGVTTPWRCSTACSDGRPCPPPPAARWTNARSWPPCSPGSSRSAGPSWPAPCRRPRRATRAHWRRWRRPGSPWRPRR